MRDIPQHTTLAQMRHEDQVIQLAACARGLRYFPNSMDYQARLEFISGLTAYPQLVVQPPVNLSRWQSFKQWLGGNMRKV